MSINTAHANNGVLIHAGEAILLFSENVQMEFAGQDDPAFKGTKNGSIYLTTHRMIFNAKKLDDAMKSFSFPFICLTDVDVEQPLFGANYIKGKVRSQENGNFVGEAKFKLLFKGGGAIDFAQAMLRAAHMAKQNAHNAAPPPYTPPSGAWFEAPPPAYAPNANGYYGWLPQTTAFPNSPSNVFMRDDPPPYPGIGPQAPPPSYPGCIPQPNYGGSNPQPNYGGSNPQPNYGGSNPGSNPQPNFGFSQPGYPQAPVPGYPPPSYPQQQNNMYPQVPNGNSSYPFNPNYAQAGYQQQQSSYPNQNTNSGTGFAPPPNSKEAEAAQSLNQQFFAPPRYNEPPSYGSLNYPNQKKTQ